MNTAMPIEKQLATMLMSAMHLRESSFDKEAADKATAKADAEKAARPDDLYVGFVDYTTFYRLTLEQACELAAQENGQPLMASILFYLLYHSWNDVQGWIKEHALLT
ncbi:MAG: hypothetical protein ABWX90_00850 [Candidatus Saccharimonadales bacterium]